MDKIAVLIPCFNEELTIEKVIKDFQKVLPEAVIYVYDNNSSDRTAEIALRAGAVVRHEYKQGKGNVIRRMFREIDAECYLITDGDDTYPAESGKEMCRMVLERQADMVVGDRLSSTYFTQNKRPFHNLGNTLVRKMINTLFSADIKDIMTGYRAFSYNFVKTFPVLSRGFEIETEMTIHAIIRNMSVLNHVIDYRNRRVGSLSKLNTFSDGIKVLFTVFKLWRVYSPFVFFTLLAIIIAFISIAFMIPILIEYFQTGLVPRFPTLIACGFCMIAALQSFWAGLILSTIQQKNKSDFEINLNAVSDKLKKLKNPEK